MNDFGQEERVGVMSNSQWEFTAVRWLCDNRNKRAMKRMEIKIIQTYIMGSPINPLTSL